MSLVLYQYCLFFANELIVQLFFAHSPNHPRSAMMYSKNVERDDEHENSGEDTSCTDMVDHNYTTPRVQTCNGNRDLCADDRQRTFARV